jgi:DNA polymerase III subunit delta
MVTLLTGENEFAVYEDLRTRVSQFLAAEGEFGLERIDAESVEPNALSAAVLQLPFLASKKLVVVKSIFANKLASDKLVEVFASIPKEVEVLLVDPKADKRTKLYKLLAKDKSIVEHANIPRAALGKWASEYAGLSGGELSASDAGYLVERVGDDQMLLAREIEKLALFGDITRDLIDSHTEQALHGSVFDLLDATFAGQKDRAMKLYDQLLAGKTDPAEILALIGWQLHVLALVKYAGAGAPSEVARATGLNPYTVGKALNTVRSMSAAGIKTAVSRALDTDVLVKTTPVNSADAVRVLLAELAS